MKNNYNFINFFPHLFSKKDVLLDIKLNGAVEPLVFQDNAFPHMDKLEQLHNNIMFYLAIMLFALAWMLLSLYLNRLENTNKILYKWIIILVISVFLVGVGWSLYNHPQAVQNWLAHRSLFIQPAYHVDLAYIKEDRILVYDRYDRTASYFRDNLVNIPPNATWVVHNFWTYLDLGDLGHRGVPDTDPTGSFQGSRLNIGTLRQQHHVQTNGAPLQYVRSLPFIAYR